MRYRESARCTCALQISSAGARSTMMRSGCILRRDRRQTGQTRLISLAVDTLKIVESKSSYEQRYSKLQRTTKTSTMPTISHTATGNTNDETSQKVLQRQMNQDVSASSWYINCHATSGSFELTATQRLGEASRSSPSSAIAAQPLASILPSMVCNLDR